MKIVFLDIDGVMNSNESAKKYRTWHRTTPPAIAALNDVLAATGASIVISSTWRETYSLDFIRGWLEGQGVKRRSVIDKTPTGYTDPKPGQIVSVGDRGIEISRWLKEHKLEEPVTNYVIFDDDYEMKDHLPFFIRTNPEVGLTIENALRAVLILCPKVVKGEVCGQQ